MNKLSTLLVLSAALTLAACGKQESAPPAAPAAAPTPAAAPAPAPAPAPAAAPAPATTSASTDVGKSLYNKTCALCHAAGVAGAPKPGDKADWAPRIAQGAEVLNKHAIEGYTGSKGQMPPRGGSTASDDEIKAAVQFMVDQSR